MEANEALFRSEENISFTDEYGNFIIRVNGTYYLFDIAYSDTTSWWASDLIPKEKQKTPEVELLTPELLAEFVADKLLGKVS